MAAFLCLLSISILDSPYQRHDAQVATTRRRSLAENIHPKHAKLHDAAREGHLLHIEEILNSESSNVIDVPTPGTGTTALMMSSHGGHTRLVSFLLDKGADVNRRDYDQGATAVHYAAGSEAHAVPDLAHAGADIDAQTFRANGGMTALHLAASRGSRGINALTMLLQSNASVNLASMATGSTALMQAARAGNLIACNLLLTHGAATQLEDHKGRTALDLATDSTDHADRDEVVRLLIDWGATRGSLIGTSTSLSAIDRKLLHAGSSREARALIDAGADPNAADAKGVTALMNAAEGGATELLETLMQAGADVDQAAHGGGTALHLAAAAGSVTCVQSLLARSNRSINAQDDRGCTALMKASEVGSSEVVHELLRHGASVDAQAANGRTALMLAVRLPSVTVVQILISAMADTYLTDADGETANGMATSEEFVSRGQTYAMNKDDDSRLKKIRELLTQSGASAVRLAVRKQDAAALRELFSRSNVHDSVQTEFRAQLLHAAREGDALGLELLLGAFGGAGGFNAFPYGALDEVVATAARGHQDALMVLLKAGARAFDEHPIRDAFVTGERPADVPKVTALQVARDAHHHGVVEILHRQQALMLAVIAADEAKATMALVQGAAADMQVWGGLSADGYVRGFTPLINATKASHPSMMKVLLLHGADPNRPDTSGSTPLFYAKTPAVAGLLLRHNATVDHLDPYGDETPLTRISSKILRMSDHCRSQALDQSAVDESRAELRDLLGVAHALLQAGANPNRHNEQEGSLLTKACTWYNETCPLAHGNLELVELFLEHGADPTIPEPTTSQGSYVVDSSGRTQDVEPMTGLDNCMHRLRHIRVLLRFHQRAVVTYQTTVDEDADTWGESALMLAAHHGDTELMSLLLENGAIVDIEDEHGERALDYARRAKQAKAVDLLMRWEREAFA